MRLTVCTTKYCVWTKVTFVGSPLSFKIIRSLKENKQTARVAVFRQGNDYNFTPFVSKANINSCLIQESNFSFLIRATKNFG